MPAAVLACAMLLATAARAADEGLDAARGIVRLALAEEPASLDSLRATDQASTFVLSHTNEGLLHYGADDHLEPAIAERWQADALGARFELRRDARWADGTPVTARDFVFAWRELLRPQTAAPYASLLFAVRNARAIVAGRLPPESLGVRARGDHVLEVECERPCAGFPALTAGKTLLPVQEAFYRRAGTRYASAPEFLLANGPFRLSGWVRGARLELERNPHWRDAAAVRIARIEIPYMTAAAQAEFNLFLDRRIALANVPPDAQRQALHERLQLESFADGYVASLVFNLRPERATRSRALRRAIRAALDPAELVDRILRVPGMAPAYSVFPAIFRGARGEFTAEYPLPPAPRDAELAVRELAAARAELAVQGPLALHVLTGEAPQTLRVGEYLQARLRTVLGIAVRLDRQITRQRLARMVAGDFDIALNNWGPDYDDPLSIAETLASWSPVNRGAWHDEPYDRLLGIVQSSTDPGTRLAALDGLQRRVFEEVPLLPLYQNARLYVVDPRLQGVRRSRFGGDPWLGAASIGGAP